MLAWCHLASDWRTFRVDRIDAGASTWASATTTASLRPSTTSSASPTPSASTSRSARELPWLADTDGVDLVGDLADGRTVVRLAVASRAYLSRLLLQAGPDAEVLSPASLRGAGAEAATRILARYGSRPRTTPHAARRRWRAPIVSGDRCARWTVTVRVHGYAGDGTYYLADAAHELDGLRDGPAAAGPVGRHRRATPWSPCARSSARPSPGGHQALDVIVAAPKPVSLLLAIEPPAVARERRAAARAVGPRGLRVPDGRGARRWSLGTARRRRLHPRREPPARPAPAHPRARERHG